MGPDEITLQVLRDLRDEVAEPPSVIFGKLWQSSEVPDDWRKYNLHS